MSLFSKKDPVGIDKNLIRTAICLFMSLLSAGLFLSIADQFYEETVNNVFLGISIMSVTFLLAPYFFLVFLRGTVGQDWKVPLKTYLWSLLFYAGIFIFAFVFVYLVENFKI